MADSKFTFLSGDAIQALKLPAKTVLHAVEHGLIAQCQQTARTEPTTSFKPIPERDNLLSVIRGTLGDANRVMVKTVGTFPDNPASGMVANPGLVTLLDAQTGMPKGILDAATITTMRTAAVTALGAKYLARNDAKILGCIGSRGIALQALHYIAEVCELNEIRIYSPNAASRDAAVAALSRALDIKVTAQQSWWASLDGADIMIDGSSLRDNQPLFPVDVIAPGVLMIAYGFYSAMPPGVFAQFDRLVMDRWVADQYGAFGPHVAAGEIGEQDVGALMGDVINGNAVGRCSEDESLVFWHRGVAACDIALAGLLLEKAQAKGVGQSVRC